MVLGVAVVAAVTPVAVGEILAQSIENVSASAAVTDIVAAVAAVADVAAVDLVAR